MIDIHNHILPGIDDGPRTVEESIELAEVAIEDGVAVIVATPHSSDLESLPPGTYAARLQELRSALKEKGMPLTVVPGLENYLTPDLTKRWQAGAALTLGERHYMLVEFPLYQYPLYTDEALFDLQLKGIVPIIAHPERNDAIRQDISRLQKLVERGMLAQITTASLLGNFGSAAKRLAETILARNLAQIIATDAHTARDHRNPVLSGGVAAAARIIGKDRAMAMVKDIPEAILAGKAVAVEPPIAAPRPLWAFWRR
ncbi:MAG: CpsB/CapC family capsule biosynthesis tyrosine phosphatase [Chloroflexota bacterium]|nr:CpsB/CapC family capsule biosynthesis tyrosine phosphatase [Chloroflexota bacterium]